MGLEVVVSSKLTIIKVVLSDWKALEVIYGHRQVPSLKVKADGAETLRYLILRRFESFVVAR